MHRECCHKLNDDAVKKLKEYVEAGGYLFTEDWGLADMLERAWPDLVAPGPYLPEGEVDVAPARGATTHPMLRGVFVSAKKIIREKDLGKQREKNLKGGPVTEVPEDVRKKIEENVKKPDNKWKIDDESPYIEVKDKRKVTVLMTSQKIAELSDGHGTVAFTFGGPNVYGKGERRRGGKNRTQVDESGSVRKLGPRVPGVTKGRVLHVLSHFARQHAKEDEFALQNLALNFLLEAYARRRK